MAQVNGFTDLENYSVIGGTQPGQVWTALNPRTKKREPIVTLSPGMASNVEGEPSSPHLYGFLSENPEYAHTQMYGPEKESGTKFGLLGKIISNPATYLSILGGSLASGLAAGAGMGGAPVAEIGAAGVGTPGIESVASGSTMPVGAYNPANPLGLGGSDMLTTNLLGDLPLSGGASLSGLPGTVAPYTGDLGQFSGLNNQVTNLAGGGLIDAVPGATSWLDNLGLPSGLKDSISKLIGGAGGAAGAAATAAGALGAAGSSSLNDILKTILTGGAGVLQDVQKSNQADKLYDLAARYEGYGAPSRGRYEASFAPGFSMGSDPGFTDALNQSAKGTMHALSATGGANPFGSPNAWGASLQDLFQKNAYPALQSYRNTNAVAGGVGNSSSVAPNIFGQAINADSQVGAGTAGAVGSIFNPPTSLADILKQLGR